LIVTSVEFDHADIYRDLDHVKSAFRELVAGMPPDGTIVAALAHEGVRDVVADAPCAVIGYGIDDEPPFDGRAFVARDVTAERGGTRFALDAGEGGTHEVLSPLFGRFNVENALAALAAVTGLGAPLAGSIAALPGFKGVKRRQEVRGVARGVTVIDDFAHHPTAVAGCLGAVAARFPGRRIVAVFEPRTNTSRRRVFQEAYVEALLAADHAVVFEVPEEPIYSATGEVTALFSAPELVRALSARGRSAVSFASVEAIVEHLDAYCAPGDVVLVMSNGGFGNIWEKLLAALGAG
jgi:UDP-N-acetylmuramate: L-alanyl-gamma-D-glutamyl-meso-diaminopimelate ligase